MDSFGFDEQRWLQHSNYTGWFNYLKNTMHLNYLITKAADGGSVPFHSTPCTVVNAAHAAGIKIFPYFYIYGAT